MRRHRIGDISGAAAHYIEQAVRFVPRPRAGAADRPLRVARTLVTCRVAAAALSALVVPAESESTYLFVNVHNPSCPLFYDREAGRWSHAEAVAEHPAWGINWAGAVLISEYLGGRLPSEREWQCFASNNDPLRRFPWGAEPPNEHLANFAEHFGGTSEVTRFPPSEIGLHDLAGNLCEWCSDACGTGGTQQRQRERVVKGGAWSKDAHHLLIHASRGKWERLGTTTIGFRPVWDD